MASRCEDLTSDSHPDGWVGEPRESRSTTVTDHGELKAARVVPIRDLGEDLSAALARINSSGEPTLVSRHGQFVALITPLAGQRVESRALADDPVLFEALRGEAADAAVDRDTDLSVAEVRARLREQMGSTGKAGSDRNA